MTETQTKPKSPSTESEQRFDILPKQVLLGGILLLSLCCLSLTVFFFWSAFKTNHPISQPVQTSKETESSKIPQKHTCDLSTMPTPLPGKGIYTNIGHCFYFFYPDRYRQDGHDIVNQDVEPDDVNTGNVLIHLSDNQVTNDQFSLLRRAEDGKEVSDLKLSPGTMVYKIKNSKLGNTQGVMYLVQSPADKEIESTGTCTRFFAIKTVKSIVTIEDRLSDTVPKKCSLRNKYPRNDLDEMLETLTVNKDK